MKVKIQQSFISGVVATIVMTIFMMLSPLMGMPEMDIAGKLSKMLGFSLAVGWIMHFMIGIIFAFLYVFFFLPVLHKTNSVMIKGLLFGIATFIVAQIMMQIMGTVFGEPPVPKGSMVLMIVGSVVGHLIFGIVVAFMVKGNLKNPSNS